MTEIIINIHNLFGNSHCYLKHLKKNKIEYKFILYSDKYTSFSYILLLILLL